MAQCRCSAVYAVVSMLVGVFGLMPTTQPDNSEWGVLVNDDTCSTAGGRCSLKLLQKNVHQEARGLKSAKSEQSSPQRREVQSLHLKAKSSPQQDEAGGWNPHKMEHWVPPPRHPALSSHEDTWQKQLFTFLQSAMDVKEISKWRESAQRTSGGLLWLRIVFVVVEFAVLLSVSLWARIAASQSSVQLYLPMVVKVFGTTSADNTPHKCNIMEMLGRECRLERRSHTSQSCLRGATKQRRPPLLQHRRQTPPRSQTSEGLAPAGQC